jgi:hypothetical protein
LAFLRLSKILLPSWIAAIIAGKSSFNQTKSVASRATLVPGFPIAILTSLAFNIGASFTPSPVIAII